MVVTRFAPHIHAVPVLSFTKTVMGAAAIVVVFLLLLSVFSHGQRLDNFREREVWVLSLGVALVCALFLL